LFQISAVFPHLREFENVRVALQRKRAHLLDFLGSEKVPHALDPQRVRCVVDRFVERSRRDVARARAARGGLRRRAQPDGYVLKRR